MNEIASYHLFKSNRIKNEKLLYECSFDYDSTCNPIYTVMSAENNKEFEFQLKSLQKIENQDYYVTDYSSICMSFIWFLLNFIFSIQISFKNKDKPNTEGKMCKITFFIDNVEYNHCSYTYLFCKDHKNENFRCQTSGNKKNKIET